MNDTEKRRSLSSFLKSFSDKILGKEAHKKIETSKMSDDDFCVLDIKERGGCENLILVDSFITRLWIEVKETEKINSEKIEALGSEGIISYNSCRHFFDKVYSIIQEHVINNSF